jgi:hypothetical protein
MKRVRYWLQTILIGDDKETNEYGSSENTSHVTCNDESDDDTDLLVNEKQITNVERTDIEARRVLPLFQSEINRKMRQHDLLLTRLELDLYVM